MPFVKSLHASAGILRASFIGAGGGTRTRTTFYSPGILSPVRLPFRHTGNTIISYLQYKPRDYLRLARYLVPMQSAASRRRPHPNAYRKVLDSRKRRVRGMWQRNDHFYANLTVCDDLG